MKNHSRSNPTSTSNTASNGSSKSSFKCLPKQIRKRLKGTEKAMEKFYSATKLIASFSEGMQSNIDKNLTPNSSLATKTVYLEHLSSTISDLAEYCGEKGEKIERLFILLRDEKLNNEENHRGIDRPVRCGDIIGAPSAVRKFENRTKYSFDNFRRILVDAQKYCEINRGDVVVRGSDIYDISIELEEVNMGISKLNWMMKTVIGNNDSENELICKIDEPEHRYGLHIAIEKLNNRAIELQKTLYSLMGNRFDWYRHKDPIVSQEEL